MSATESTSPIQQRDMRSAAKPFKRDRDSDEKWSNGTRPLYGMRPNYNNAVTSDEYLDDAPNRPEKFRPGKQWTSLHKSHGNKNPKPKTHLTYDAGCAAGRVERKTSALIDANDHTSSPLSRSLLELLPQYTNDAKDAIQSAAHECDSSILYSYDSKISSPTTEGRAIGLDSLVDMAEQKWVAEQTDKIVKGEYEVLDADGEIVIPSKNKKKGSPKQRAVKTMPSAVKNVDVEEDGFQLV